MEKITKDAAILAPMNGGDGVYSYAHNSTIQRKLADGLSGMIREGILEMFDMTYICSSSPPTPIRIADLGCSVGPNTFVAMQNIVNAMQHKYQSQGLHNGSLEFLVFFNDHTTNDFNKLFSSFPPQKVYFAAGIPGSFHGRLFQVSSLHFVHSSASLHWLSKVPKQVTDAQSPVFNKGRIHHRGAPKEVNESYLAQFYEDMESFLSARADEVVTGGFMALSLVTIRERPVPTPTPFDIICSCLMEMAQQGFLKEAQVDSFNIPMYFPSAEEFVETMEKNGSFSIEKLDISMYLFDTSVLDGFAAHLRAMLEGLLSAHFGNEIMDDLFALFTQKAGQIYTADRSCSTPILYVLLKRK